MKKALLIGCAAWMGCVAEPVVELEPAPTEEPSPEAPSAGAPYLAWDPEQGRHILGSFADGLASGGWHFHVSILPSNRPGFRLSVNDAGVNGVNGTHLVADDGPAPASDHVGTDLWFDGAILDGPGGQLRIRRSEPTGSDIVSTIYFLDYRPVVAGNPGAWVNYCGPSGGGAIALSGRYDSRRIHYPGVYLSFGCADGVTRKCNKWGYVAGNAGPGDANWDYHQACTGMANANYCGTGEPFTREKTPIVIRDEVPDYGSDYGPYDLKHPEVMPGHPDQYYIEAGWDRWGHPVCVSRFRWAALSPDQCGPRFPDPRFSDDKTVTFCDDWTIEELFDKGALLVNGSKVMDAPLHRWRNAYGDEVSTIRGYFVDRNRDGTPDNEWAPPFPGYNVHVGVDGMLLRNLPGTLDVSQMRPLYSRIAATTGDRYLDDGGGGPTDPSFEGYSFVSSPTVGTDGVTVGGLAPLSLCHRGGDRDTVWGSLLGCTLIKGLSYALQAP